MSADVAAPAPLTEDEIRAIGELASDVLLCIAHGEMPNMDDVAKVTGDSARLSLEVWRLRAAEVVSQEDRRTLALVNAENMRKRDAADAELQRLRANLRIEAEADAYYRALAQDDRATTGETVRCEVRAWWHMHIIPCGEKRLWFIPERDPTAEEREEYRRNNGGEDVTP